MINGTHLPIYSDRSIELFTGHRGKIESRLFGQCALCPFTTEQPTHYMPLPLIVTLNSRQLVIKRTRFKLRTERVTMMANHMCKGPAINMCLSLCWQCTTKLHIDQPILAYVISESNYCQFIWD